MTTVTSTTKPVAIECDPLERLGGAAGRTDEPAFAQQLRERGARAFARLGLPTAKHEEWRYTNVAPVRERSFAPPGAADAAAAQRAVAQATPFESAALLVFVNGAFCAELSKVGQEAGVRILPMAQALRDEPATLERWLGAVRDVDDDAFAHACDALFSDGAFVRIDKGARLDRPVHVVHALLEQERPTAVHTRSLIVADEGASCAIVEETVGLEGAAPLLCNALTEVVLAQGARASLVRTARDAGRTLHIESLRVHQEAESALAAHSLQLGAQLLRSNVSPVLAGENCSCELHGVYLPAGEQHMDNHMRVVHAAPNCFSRQQYRGVMQDRSRGVFTGRIIVEQQAQKTDAIQSCRNILLSPDARANAKPQLEIYADDVRCTHGATVGQLDEEAVFYLQARGLRKTQARALLVHAFVKETLDRIEREDVRRAVEQLAAARLPGGAEIAPLLADGES